MSGKLITKTAEDASGVTYKVQWLKASAMMTEMWKLPSQYTPEGVLGSGSYGTVLRATDTSTMPHGSVAIKKITNPTRHRTIFQRIVREVAILRRLTYPKSDSHPYVVTMPDILDLPPSGVPYLSLVMANGGTDLEQLSKAGTVLTVEEVSQIFKQILLAMEFLHDSQVIHRDIKPANILVEKLVDSEGPLSYHARVADFGLSRVLPPGSTTNVVPEVLAREDEKAVAEEDVIEDDDVAPPPPQCEEFGVDAPSGLTRTMTKHVVTRYYRPPEVVANTGIYSTEIDCWSVGCVLAELLPMLQPETVAPNPRRRRHIFPGVSSYNSAGATTSNSHVHIDLIKKIVTVMGAPTEDELASWGLPPRLVEAVRALSSGPVPLAQQDLDARFPGSTPEMTDMLRGLLRYNPKDRFSMCQACAHAMVTSVAPYPGNKRHSNCTQSMHEIIHLDLEGLHDAHDIPGMEQVLRDEIGALRRAQENEITVPNTGAPGANGDATDKAEAQDTPEALAASVENNASGSSCAVI